MHVPGSRRYADPGTYLFTSAQWAPRQAEFCALVGKPADGRHALEQGVEELHAAVTELETVLAKSSPDDVGAVRLDAEGRLVNTMIIRGGVYRGRSFVLSPPGRPTSASR